MSHRGKESLLKNFFIFFFFFILRRIESDTGILTQVVWQIRDHTGSAQPNFDSMFEQTDEFVY